MNDFISRQAAKNKKVYSEERHEYVVPVAELDWLPPAQPEQSSEIQDILEYLDTVLHPIISPDHWNVYSELHDMISMLPSAQPEQIARDIATIIENEKDMRVILNAPSAQSEIIRCKDCMHNGSFDTDCPIDWNGKEYCSFAERKEDE